jgi:hypothetical protein
MVEYLQLKLVRKMGLCKIQAPGMGLPAGQIAHKLGPPVSV